MSFERGRFDRPPRGGRDFRDRPDDRPPREEKLRVFVALQMPDVALEALAKLQGELRAEPELAWNVNFPRGTGLHVTLQFLGEISAGRARAVSRAVQEVAAEHAPFRLDLAGLGAFPKLGRARVVWTGLRSGLELLSRIQRQLEDLLIKNGFPREDRRFEPHLTLARLKDPADLRRLVEKYATFAVPGVPAAALHVMKSELHREGSLYTALSTAPLGVPAPGEQSA